MIATQNRRWPNPWMLYYADLQEGVNEWFTLKQFYGDSHPDTQRFLSLTPPERGEVTRRRFVELFRLALLVSNGQLPLETFARRVNGPVPRHGDETRDFVEIVFGKTVAERYSRSRSGSYDPGYSPDEIVAGAFLLRVTYAQMGIILQTAS